MSRWTKLRDWRSLVLFAPQADHGYWGATERNAELGITAIAASPNLTCSGWPGAAAKSAWATRGTVTRTFPPGALARTRLGVPHLLAMWSRTRAYEYRPGAERLTADQPFSPMP
jgi:hypothetical protein